MKKALVILLFIPLIASSQNSSSIDSLKSILNDPTNHDTVIYSTYNYLGETINKQNPDSAITIWKNTSSIISNKISKKDKYKKQLGSIQSSILNNMGTYYKDIENNPDLAEEYYNQSLHISEELNNKKNKITALSNLGELYYETSKLDRALRFFDKSLILSNEIMDTAQMVSVINNIGFTHFKKGDITKAVSYLNQSLLIAESSKIVAKSKVAVFSRNIGYIYSRNGDTNEAMDYYKKSLKISEELNDNSGIARCFHLLGILYGEQKNWKESEEYLLKSLAIRKQLNNKSDLASSYSNIGFMYKSAGNFKAALEYLLKGVEIEEELNDPSSLSYKYMQLSEVYISMEKLDKAAKYAKKAHDIAQQLGYPQLIQNTSLSLTRIYQGQGKYKQSLDMYILHIEMKDSLNNSKTQKAVAQQQAKYEYEKQKVLDDAENEKKVVLEKEAKEKQKIIAYATAGGLILVLSFLAFVFNRLRVTRKQKKVIELQKIEVEKQKDIVETAHEKLEEKNTEIMDSINYAKRIQSAILPPDKAVKEYLKNSFILYKPKDIVAGDFYWMEQKDDKTLFAAADCTGHGVPGAMVSVVCNNALNRSVREHGLTNPGEILNKTREIVVQEFEKSDEEVKDGMDIALCSLEKNKLQYAGANNPLWIIRNGEIIETKANKQPIGKFDNPLPYATHAFDLQKNDTFYIFSDGFVDQFGGDRGKKFKPANFRKLLLSIQKESMQQQKELINTAFENWRGNVEQVDDVCVIGVRI